MPGYFIGRKFFEQMQSLLPSPASFTGTDKGATSDNTGIQTSASLEGLRAVAMTAMRCSHSMFYIQNHLKQASLNMFESSNFKSERLNKQFSQVTVSQQCTVQGHSMLPLPTFGTSTNYLVTSTSQSYVQSACQGIACCWIPV